MHSYTGKSQQGRHKTVADNVSQKLDSGESTFQFVDARPEVIVQNEQQAMADKSVQTRESHSYQEMANHGSPDQQTAQLQKIAENYYPQHQFPIQKNENKTGLPDNLKTGVENLSGYSMDDVKVHYNSNKPAQLQAHAYAQGTDIHLGPGQERHLPHEAWHVVQQKQGRVKPTMQMKESSINDDNRLEREADLMGRELLGVHEQNSVQKTRPDPMHVPAEGSAPPQNNMKINRASFGDASIQMQEDITEKQKDKDILNQDPEKRKELARDELLASIDELDGATGEELEAALAKLKTKYGLSKVNVDTSNPKEMKIELYASPCLIIGGIALGIVVIGGIGIAGYFIYKRIKYNRIINRLTGAGYTNNQAQTLLGLHNNVNELIAWAPVILRQIGDGVAINQGLITNVSRQIGTADKIQEIQEANAAQNLGWGQQNGPLDGTALGRWILDNSNPEPNAVNGNMNCWEVVMFSAYKMGYLSWQNMHDAYSRDIALQNGLAGQGLNDYFSDRIRDGNVQRQFDPNDVNSPQPLKGDLVLFENAEAHTTLAAGTVNAGSPEVFSLWDRPNHDYLQRLTINALLAAGADEPIYFFSPNWA